MSMEYSDPARESDPYALPDLEIFRIPFDYEPEPEEPDDEPYEEGWYYWWCLPGCMPDSPPYGPYNFEAEALAAARENS